MHEKIDENNKLKSDIMIEFKESYNRLLETIKKYKFKENSSRGFAAKQNRNNRLILHDLQMLNGKLDEILQYIDSFIIESNSDKYIVSDKNIFERGTSQYLVNRVVPMIPHKLSKGICTLNPNDYSEEKTIIDNSLKLCIRHMNDADKKTNDAMYTYYYDTEENQKNSAVRARIWKKEKNNALHIIINVATILSIMGDMINNISVNNSKINSVESIQRFMDYLSKGPNYYSYLPPYKKIK